MDVILEDLMRKFQADRGLSDLSRDQLLETFAAYCVLGQFHEDEFDPDELRMGGSRDLGIDAAAVVINNAMYTNADEVRECVARSNDLRVHFVIVQAKAEDRFESEVFTQLATNLHQVFGGPDLTFNASEKVKKFRECVQAVYAQPKKLTSEKPQLSVWYATTCGVPDDAVLKPRKDAATAQMQSLNRFGTVQFRALGARGLQELYQRASEALSATVTMNRSVELPAMPGVTQAYVGVVPARDFVTNVLTDPVGDIRSVLFHDNVRAFQGYGSDSSGNKVGVNAEIRQTLQDDAARPGFAVLNNGITIVARNLVVLGNDFTLRDFQIVNGCQT